MIKIKTSILQEMVSRVSQCVGNNKLIPLTSLISIAVVENQLQLTTTDATNYFYVYAPDKFDSEDVEVSVMADTFIKLIQKTTSEFTELHIEQGVLRIVGDGTYVMELPLDENGNIIKFPKKVGSGDFRKKVANIKLSTVKTILNYNKPSLATSVELPVLTCYYCGDSVITSDQYKVCSTAIKLFDSPMLITAQMMELLGNMSDEDIIVSVTDENSIVFQTNYEMLYAPIPENVESYPITQIGKLLDFDFASECSIPKTGVLNLLERLSLFVSPYDKKAIKLTFTKEGILFSSKKSNGTELIPYVTSTNFEPYVCSVDIDMLKSQIQTQVADSIKLYYGHEMALKLVTDNVKQIVALALDE